MSGSVRRFFCMHTLKYLALLIGGGIFILFLYFLFSGVPGFYDPYKLDGKGVDPRLYLCDRLRQEPIQCPGTQYWKQAVPVAGIKTAIILLAPPTRLIVRLFN